MYILSKRHCIYWPSYIQAITRSVKVVSPVEFLMCGRFAYFVEFINGNSFMIHFYGVSKWITKTRFNLKMTFLHVGNNDSFCIWDVLKTFSQLKTFDIYLIFAWAKDSFFVIVKRFVIVHFKRFGKNRRWCKILSQNCLFYINTFSKHVLNTDAHVYL